MVVVFFFVEIVGLVLLGSEQGSGIVSIVIGSGDVFEVVIGK